MADKLLPLDVIEIDFLTILPIWMRFLWFGRTSPIKPVSSMLFLGGYDMSIYPKYTQQARYFGVRDLAGNLVGVFSGHPTSDTDYRGRGLYVIPSFQDIGIGTNLVKAVTNAAAMSGREICWCLPRVENVQFFQRCGFTVMSDPTNAFEFGPNVYMAKAIVPA